MQRVTLLPGGELSDVTASGLGVSRHQLVKNLKQIREGEWEVVKGHVVVYEPSGTPSIKAGCEVDDDQSGDRFILYQDGTSLKRVDYSPSTGYTGASPSTLTLPSGISIGSSTVCKFFVNLGVVRITGPTDGTKGVPLWYGYINRTLFPDAWKEIALDCFETGPILTVTVTTPGTGYSAGDVLTLAAPTGGTSATFTVATVASGPPGPVATVTLVTAGSGYVVGTEYASTVAPTGGSGCKLTVATVSTQWTANSATLSQYDCVVDGDTAGTVFAPEKTNAMKVLQTGAGGSARKSWTVTNGKTVRVLAMVFKKAGGTGSVTVKIGKTAGGAEYATLTTATTGAWVKLENTGFTTSSTALHVELIPGSGAADAAYFDFIFIEENASIAVSGWKLCKSALTPLSCVVSDAFYFGHDSTEDTYPVGNDFLAKFSTVHDDSQFSLMSEASVDTDEVADEYVKLTPLDYEIGEPWAVSAFGIKIRVDGATIASDLASSRASRILLALSRNIVEGNYFKDEDEYAFYVEHDIDLTETIVKKYTSNMYYWETGWAPNKVGVYKGTHGGSTSSYSVKDDHFLYKGARIKFSTEAGEVDTVVTEVGTDSGWGDTYSWFTVAQDMTIYHGSSPIWNYFGIELEQKWVYDAANGYSMVLGVGISGTANEFYDYSDIPAGTSDNTPDYDQHVVDNDVACVVSNEDGEEDTVRYSPSGQPDNFPILNLVDVIAGDGDSVKWIGAKNGRFIALKRNSVSQFGWSGSSFNIQRKVATNGLYSGFLGAIVEEDFVYFMDADDLYVFDGNRAFPLMENEKLRKIYRENVTTSSFLLWDKLNNELQVHLSASVILVWNRAFKEWYQRVTAYTLLGGFRDADSRLLAFSLGKFVTVNHALTTYSETMGWEFQGMLLDGDNPEDFKQVSKIMLQLSSNFPVQVKLEDPNETRVYSKSFSTPSASVIGMLEDYPDYQFLEVKATAKSVTNTTTMTATVKRLVMEVE